MKAYSGFKSEANANKPKALPAGPYVAKIKAVKIEGNEPDQQLVLRVDIEEGPYEKYFFKRYISDKENSKYEPRYKGDFKLRIPNDENTKAMYPESDRKRFNDAIYRIEESNPGYHWDWNENGLVGLLVGINMQEDEYNGFRFTKIGRLEIAQAVRDGKVTVMEPRERKGDAYDTFPATPPADQQAGFTAVECDTLPF